MDLEEEAAKKKASYEIGMDLSEMSVEEIHETISMLQEEIARLQETATAKSDHLSAAEALFKS